MVYGLFFSLSNRGVLGLLGRALIRPGERWKCSVHSLIPRGGSIEWAGLGEGPPAQRIPAMAAAESCWWRGPSADASRGCQAAVSAPKGQLSGLKKHLKKSMLQLFPRQVSGLEKACRPLTL